MYEPIYKAVGLSWLMWIQVGFSVFGLLVSFVFLKGTEIESEPKYTLVASDPPSPSKGLSFEKPDINPLHGE